MTLEEQLSYLKKGTVDCISEEDLKRKLERAAKTGKVLRVKAGFDPTAPEAMRKQIEDEIANWKAIVKANDIKVN